MQFCTFPNSAFLKIVFKLDPQNFLIFKKKNKLNFQFVCRVYVRNLGKNAFFVYKEKLSWVFLTILDSSRSLDFYKWWLISAKYYQLKCPALPACESLEHLKNKFRNLKKIEFWKKYLPYSYPPLYQSILLNRLPAIDNI